MGSKINKSDYLAMIHDAYEAAYGQDEKVVFSETPQAIAAKERLLNAAKRNITDMSAMSRDEILEKLPSSCWITINRFVVQIYAMDKNLMSLSISEEVSKIHRKLDPKRDMRFDQAEWREFFASKMAVRMPLERVVEMVRWLQSISRVVSFC